MDNELTMCTKSCRNVSICNLLCKILKSTKSLGQGLRFKIGLFLLLTNVPFGYGGFFICTAMAAAHQNQKWLYCGSACYGISWIMLGIGTWLVGADAKNFLLKTTKRKWRAWKKMRISRKGNLVTQE